jgi:hypothetical protein
LFFRYLFGNVIIALLGEVMDQMPLEQKIALLMSLAGDDREASPSMPASLPPRLRHANDVGALRPLNFRTVSAGRGRRTNTAAHPHDECVQLQLSLLPHAPRPQHAARAAQAARGRPNFSRRAPARVV